MKKLILIASSAFMLLSCKKEVPEPVPPVQTPPTTTECSLMAFALNNVTGYNMPSGHNWYTDFSVVIDGDTIGNLTNQTTSRGFEKIFEDYASGIPLPGGGLSHSVTFGQSYHLEILDRVTKLILAEGEGLFKIDSDGETVFFCNEDNTECGISWNYNNLDQRFPNGHDVADGEDVGGIKSTGKFFFVAGLTVND